jgi:hypothetical protein
VQAASACRDRRNSPQDQVLMEIPNAHETDSRSLLDLRRLEAQMKMRESQGRASAFGLRATKVK